MMPGGSGLIFAIFALLALGALVYGLVMSSRRRDAAVALATRLGLQYSQGDPLDIVHLPHRIFRKGDRRRVDTTLMGTMRGRQVALCDYVYTEVSRDAQGNTHQSDYRFSLCVLRLPRQMPWIEITPESLGRRFLNMIGVGNDVQFESDEFNREFQVLSDQRDFALTLIDPGMIEWLLSRGRDCHIEIEGADLIVATRQLPWEQMDAFAGLALEFEDRMPPLAAEQYGRGS